MSANRLDREVSPYLLQHKDNPAHWLPWGAEAFDLARRTDRPILLSVGYAACHWCHVMAHESFENPATAAVMNELFVNIKVDREERPDIDQIYQAALAALGQPGGWPLTMFLNADGEPFWGGTYFPPRAMYGRPSFTDVLHGVAATWRDHHGKVTQNAEVLRGSLRRLTESAAGGDVAAVTLDRIADRLVREVDPVFGGIGGAPKFPQTPLFELLWRAHLRTGSEPAAAAVANTLARMCQGGLYDHLGGGFARYSTDERWLAPHFEKMLYDNGQLLRLMAMVWRKTESPLLEARIRETVGWLLREMVADGGGFAASLDADSEGKEGRFYVWSEAEIDAVLGSDAGTFKATYDVTRAGNWEGANILNRPDQPTLGDVGLENTLAELREKLLHVRAKRVRPGWDDKVLADWNGLAILGLAEAAATFDEPEWSAAAVRAYRFVRDRMTVDGRLRHTARAGMVKHSASVDDLAAMTAAALALFNATGDDACLKDAEAWVAALDVHHWDGEQGGYFFTADDAASNEGAPLICRVKSAHDGSTPAGNGILPGALARLYALTGNEAYARRGDELLTAFSGELGHNFFPLPTLLNSVDARQRLTQVVLVGEDDALTRAVFRYAPPDLTVLRVADPSALPAGHPAYGKTAPGGKATAYVCRGQTCSAPTADPATLAQLLNG